MQSKTLRLFVPAKHTFSLFAKTIPLRTHFYSTKQYLKEVNTENNAEKREPIFTRKERAKQAFEQFVLQTNTDVQSIRLNTLESMPGSRKQVCKKKNYNLFKKKRRLGRGPGSTKGGTSGRGSHGQRARTSINIPTLFEGGTTPLHRRLPKYGFLNRKYDNTTIMVTC